MSEVDRELDERITRQLAAVRAEADPALWTRVRARIEAAERERARGWVGWLMRPAALGASLAVLALALVTSAALVATAPRGGTRTAETLEDALVLELETRASGTTQVSPAAPRSASDSGAAR